MWFAKNIIVGMTLICSSLAMYSLRPKELQEFYKMWKPLELVRGLRSLSVDPYDVLRALEAVKDLDSEEALDAMHDLAIRPITIYDALEDLGVHPFDAYYALKAWLTDPLLHQPGDHYHRVNISGDPTHPYLHVLYKKHHNETDEYTPFFLTSKEVNEELQEIENEYKRALNEDKFRMNEFIRRAKEIHAAFDDPTKVFKDFFGDRHFDEWKNTFPEAFKNLKDIYQNPLGFGLKKSKTELNETTKPETVYGHVHKGREYLNKQAWNRRQSDSFSRFNDPSRYDTLLDESRTENVEPSKGEKAGKTRIHHTKVFYDKKKNLFIECKETQEHVQTGTGMSRRVSSNVKHFDPKSYEIYRQKKEKEELERQQKQTQLTPPPQTHQQPPPQPKQPPPHPQQSPPQQQPPPQPQQPTPQPQQSPSQPQQPPLQPHQQPPPQTNKHPPPQPHQPPPQPQQPPPQEPQHPQQQHLPYTNQQQPDQMHQQQWQYPYQHHQQFYPPQQPYYHPYQQPYPYPQDGYPYGYQQQHFQQPQPPRQDQQPEHDPNRANRAEHDQFHNQQL